MAGLAGSGPDVYPFATVGGGNGNAARAAVSTVAGGENNVADNYLATVSGGSGNSASGVYSAVGGGASNEATGTASFVGGGIVNQASGTNSSIGGGSSNQADGGGSAVGGGGDNVATGLYAAIPGGRDNLAAGDYSVSMGRRARSNFDGTFVFADSSNFDFPSANANNFRVRATGGARFVVDIDGTGAITWGCTLFSGDSWVCTSDVNQKQNLQRLDGERVLDKLVAMPVYAWNPKGVNAHVLHYGPTAQDFRGAFGLGDTDLGIGQQDADGVALAAIQGLNAKLEARLADQAGELALRDARIAEQARALEALRAESRTEIAELKRSVEILLARTSPGDRLAQRR